MTVGLFANPDFFQKVLEDGTTGPYFEGEGLFYGGGLSLFGEQALANIVAIIYSFVVTTIIVVALKKTVGVRVSDEVESTGLDLAQHAETAYHNESGVLGRIGS